MKTLTEDQFKDKLNECLEYARSKNDEVYYSQAAEVIEMLIEGLEE